MKQFIFSLALLCFVFGCSAQKNKTSLAPSPMAMSYLPDNYPLLKIDGKIKEDPIARVIYCRPQKKGRTTFGGIVPYNENWRLGANEATEIEFFKPVTIAGTAVPAGRYTLYCIPTPTKWTIILSKDNYTWGSYGYDAKKDVLRTDIPVTKNDKVIEAFTMYFEDAKPGANLIMLWDEVKTSLPIGL